MIGNLWFTNTMGNNIPFCLIHDFNGYYIAEFINCDYG